MRYKEVILYRWGHSLGNRYGVGRGMIPNSIAWVLMNYVELRGVIISVDVSDILNKLI